MTSPRARTGLLAALLLLGSLGVATAAAEREKLSPEAEYRAGWLAYVAPATASGKGPATAQERADLALTHFQAAAAADPKNVSYQTAVAYVGGAAAAYDKAKEAADVALAHERRDPLLYVLRGQAEASLALMDPVKAGDKINKAITAFDRAAELDPQNALPVLQAVSVALDVDRLDLVQPRLKQALARPTCRLYRLAIPTDLQADNVQSLRTWEQLQMGLWGGLLARCQNVTNRLLRFGRQEEKLGKTEAAEAYYRQALSLSRLVGKTEPHLLITLGVAMDLLDPTYAALARFAGAQQQEAQGKGDTAAAARWKGEAERWQGEAGILQIGRAELQGALPRYFETITRTPPATPDEMLKVESQIVERAYLGIGLGEKEPKPKTPAPASH